MDYDQRVLGSSDFVTRLREEEALRDRLVPALALREVVDRIAAHYSVTAEQLCRKARAPEIVEARGLTCYLAVRRLGFRTSDLAELLQMTAAGVRMAAWRGAKVANEEMVKQLLDG